MSDILRIFDGDSMPDVIVMIYDKSTGDAVDLSASGTSVAARFRMKGTSTTLFEQACTKVDDGATGYVRMSWPSDALDGLSQGKYEMQFIVTTANGVQTVIDKQSFKMGEKFAEES